MRINYSWSEAEGPDNCGRESAEVVKRYGSNGGI